MDFLTSQDSTSLLPARTIADRFRFPAGVSASGVNSGYFRLR
ncbi:hypothetical protein SS05631_b52050 (plasmid) [Sinorhizobium sp. CCBAU 05631]|nr:hypothetical protein SS05631_b52050 [Sinorhizobium sp. CCBAU 05631]